MNYAFLHGGGQGSWVWEETIAAMDGPSVGLLPLDAPGCGAKRDRADEGMDNIDIARELIADLERAGMGDVVLVGHSQAGQVMPFMAALQPSLFRRLLYVTCSIPLPGQTVAQMMGTGPHGSKEDEVGFPFDPATTDMRDKYGTMFCNDMEKDQASSFLAKLGRDAWPMKTYAYSDWRYQDIGTVPTSYIACLRDNILPIAWQHRFAVRFKADRTVSINAGHQVMITQPEALAKAILEEAI